MIHAQQLASALRKIEAEIAQIVIDAAAHPVDPHDLHCLALKVACQAEMLEKGVLE